MMHWSKYYRSKYSVSILYILDKVPVMQGVETQAAMETLPTVADYKVKGYTVQGHLIVNQSLL